MTNLTRLLPILALLPVAAGAAYSEPPAGEPDLSEIEPPPEPAPEGPLEPAPLPDGSFTAPAATSIDVPGHAPGAIEWSPLNLAIAGIFLLLILGALGYHVFLRVSRRR